MVQASPSIDRFSRKAFLKSEIADVSDAKWDAFVRIMSVQGIKAESVSGGVGSFDLRPRRLGEIGVMEDLHRGPQGRWEGRLIAKYAPLGRDAIMQYEVFVMSMKAYDAQMVDGSVVRPQGVSRSGALGILHCGGSGALDRWPEGVFRTTKAIFDRVNDLF